MTEQDARELAQLRARMERIEAYRGAVCESSTPEDWCGPVEYSDAYGIYLCAECYAAVERDSERAIAEAITTLTEHCPAFEDVGAAIVNGQRYSQVLVRVAS